MKCLVVDDSKVARTMVARMVRQLGFDVVDAADGVEALGRLDPLDKPAAIVTDWNMPNLDGVELARAVRAKPDFAHIPVLMISSETDPRRVAKALLAGVDEYLFKPVDAEMIRDRLEIMGVYIHESA